MTLWVNRDGQTVTIHGNLGLGVNVENSRVREFTVTEQAGHLRGFWSDLGRQLDEAEKPAETGG
jgi:hypothetical protein